MWSRHRSLTLGSVNLALVSCYFFPVWGREALRVLKSPVAGFDNPLHATDVLYFSRLFDIGFSNLAITSHVIAGIKLMMVAAFVAYLIEFARSLATGRATDRETTDVVLILAVVGVLMSALPALALGDAALIRLTATQKLMDAGAITVLELERPTRIQPTTARATAADQGDVRPVEPLVDALAAEQSPPQAAVALARIPETGLRHPIDRY